MKTKRKGDYVERKVIEMFEAIGARCIRSSGSHGPFDVVACMGPAIFFIQVKANRKPGPEEIEAMRAWPSGPMTGKAYCVWKDYDKSPDFRWEGEWGE